MKAKVKLKRVVWGLIACVVVTGIAFSLTLWTVPVEVTETYTETEMRQESYWVSEPYTAEEVEHKTKVLIDESFALARRTLDLGPSYGRDARVGWARVITDFFDVDTPGACLDVDCEPFDCGLAAMVNWGLIDADGHLVGAEGASRYEVAQGRYRVECGVFAPMYRSGTGYPRLDVAVTTEWTEVVGEVTKYKQVEKYRQVPVEVERQRTVTEYQKASMWQLLFED